MKIGEPSATTLALVDELLGVDLNAIVSYAQLSRVAGRNVQHEVRGNLATARAMAEEEGIFFLVVTNEGLRRVAQEEWIQKTPPNTIERQRRMSLRRLRGLNAIKPESLAAEPRNAHAMYTTLHSTLKSFLHPKRLQSIETEVTKEGRMLSLAETMAMFAAKKVK